jgi:ribose-phosphate pyrophosphokinase
MTCAVYGFPEQAEASLRLARSLGAAHFMVEVHSFPDGESLVRVDTSPDTALLYRSLDRPNAKMIEVLLAASALRDNGAARVIFIVPYLAYMRQDAAFRAGEAVSQRVIGKLLAGSFDALLTLDPHLHRTRSLATVMPDIAAVALSAAPALGAAIDESDDPLLVGPDGEARQWVERIAERKGLEFVLGRKLRVGDREVRLDISDAERARGRKAIVVDDLISTGATLKVAARLLLQAGASSVEVLATHCLASEADLEALRAAGVDRIRATDSVPGAVGILPIAAVLADAIRRQGWCL